MHCQIMDEACSQLFHLLIPFSCEREKENLLSRILLVILVLDDDDDFHRIQSTILSDSRTVSGNDSC